MPPETESTTWPDSTRSLRAARDLHLREAARRSRPRPLRPLELHKVPGGSEEAVPGPDRLAALNVVAAVVLLAVTAPLMAIVAALVRLTSAGPVLFAQERIGLDRRAGSGLADERRRFDLGGRPVRIYKFRTMYFERQSDDQVWTRPNDTRITPVGRILRSFRIDELPQIFNVLRREMNVVGPRPEQSEIFGRLRERYERFPDRQRVLPGITGLAQVKCGYGGDDFQMRRKLEWDLEYVERRSVGTDLKILARTIPVVLLRKGAR